MQNLNLYLDEKDIQKIKKHAAAEGKSVSKFCREVLTNKTESGVILREPLEKEMIELRETVNERILDLVNIVDRLSRGVVDKEKVQEENINVMLAELKKHLTEINTSFQLELVRFERIMNEKVVKQIAEQNRILNERVEYQNKLTRELFKLMYEDIIHIKHYDKAIIEKGLDDINTAKACEKIAKTEATNAINNLGV